MHPIQLQVGEHMGVPTSVGPRAHRYLWVLPNPVRTDKHSGFTFVMTILCFASVACGTAAHPSIDAQVDAPEVDAPEVDTSAASCLGNDVVETSCDNGCDDDGNGFADCVDFVCVWDRARSECETDCRVCGDLTLCENVLTDIEPEPMFMTWNVLEFSGSPAVASRIGQVLHELEPGVVALQEVSSAAALDGVTGCVSGYTQHTASNVDRYKVVLLIRDERFAIRELFEVPMRNHRPVLGARLMDVRGAILDVYAVHLWPGADASATEERRSQMNALANYIDERDAETVVILGDFNELLSDPIRSTAFDSLVGAPVYATPVPLVDSGFISTIVGRDDLDLDHILVTRPIARRAQILRLEDVFHGYRARMSDHRPVLAW